MGGNQHYLYMVNFLPDPRPRRPPPNKPWSHHLAIIHKKWLCINISGLNLKPLFTIFSSSSIYCRNIFDCFY